MIVSNVSNTKNKLSELLQKVQQGEEILVMDRDKPVARILPIAEEPGAHNESVAARAIRMGFAAPAKRPRGGLPPLRRDDAPLSLVDSLLAEREEARY